MGRVIEVTANQLLLPHTLIFIPVKALGKFLKSKPQVGHLYISVNSGKFKNASKSPKGIMVGDLQ